jgi:hypothetical protein
MQTTPLIVTIALCCTVSPSSSSSPSARPTAIADFAGEQVTQVPAFNDESDWTPIADRLVPGEDQ